MSDDNSDGVVWNFDDAMGKLIFSMKVDFVSHHKCGDLEKSYWDLFYLMSEIEPSLDETPKKAVNSYFDEISNRRKELGSFYNIEDSETSNQIFTLTISLYRMLCSEMVGHSFYFRKKKGYEGL